MLTETEARLVITVRLIKQAKTIVELALEAMREYNLESKAAKNHLLNVEGQLVRAIYALKMELAKQKNIIIERRDIIERGGKR